MNFRNSLLILLLSLFVCAVGSSEEEEEIATNRPNKDKGPTKVYFKIFVLDIGEIDGKEQSFSANVYINLHWRDARLAHNEKYSRSFPLESVWNPRIIVANQEDILRTSLPRDVKVTPEGMVSYHQRYTGSLSQPLNLSKFPLDQQEFIIQFAAIGFDLDEIEFIPEMIGDTNVLVKGDTLLGGGIADVLSLPDWKILSHKNVAHPYQPVTQIKEAGFAFVFIAKRNFLYYLWQVVVPLSLVVGMSWAAFWIDPSQTGTQIGVATSAVLCLITTRFLLGGFLPNLPYMTRMDYFTLGSTMLVFFALMEVIMTSYLARKDHTRVARKFDRVSRLIFPTAFFVLCIFTFYI